VKNNNFLSDGYKVDEEHPGEMYAGFNSVKDSGKKIYNKAKKSIGNAINTTNDVINQAKTYMDMGGEELWISTHHGKNAAIKYAEHSVKSLNDAVGKSEVWGISGAEDNKADAYRHFAWNAQMTRDSDLGYYTARDLTNYHEYDTIKDLGWIQKDSDKFNYLKDNTIIKCKMNQPALMDLWNNQVGRELANNKTFSEMDIDSLFDMAYNNNWLITDASKTYEFLGITDYITDDYNVDAEWNLTTGNIKVKKGDKYVDLKIGV